MELRSTLIADAKPPVLVKPGQRPLHLPTSLSQPLLVIDLLLGQDRFDAKVAQPLAVRLGVVGQIPLQGIRLPSWRSGLPRYWRDGIEQRSHLVDIVDVSRRRRGGQRDTLGVGEQMGLAAGLGAGYTALGRALPPPKRPLRNCCRSRPAARP